VIDFTNAAACMAMAKIATARGLHLVTGTSGLTDADLDNLADLSRQHRVGVIVVPNFALGAVLLTYLVRIAARFFDYADIFEAHHPAKIDAPSGTAMALARAITAEKRFTRPEPEKEPLVGTMGGDYNGVAIHSTRMAGRLAHHEVVFGAAGQTLSLRHDTLNRECYMPALVLAVKEVVKRGELVVGLEGVLGLS
jgi:4-hydroxy-tetrahydrodipicolinate reductase